MRARGERFRSGEPIDDGRGLRKGYDSMVIAAKRREQGRIELACLVFQRVVAMLMIALALQYWMRLTGFSDGAEFRFDTMSEHWRFAASVMAVLLPAAALGLWGAYAWGVVLWVAAVAIEFAMHVFLSEQFGRADIRVAFLILGLVAYGALRIMLRIVNNKG